MSVAIGIVPTKTQSVGEFIRDKARSILSALSEAVTSLDELPLENKQEVKEGLVKLLAMGGEQRATIKLLTQEDEELSRILADHGWWILPKDITGPVKRYLLGFGREGILLADGGIWGAPQSAGFLFGER